MKGDLLACLWGIACCMQNPSIALGGGDYFRLQSWHCLAILYIGLWIGNLKRGMVLLWLAFILPSTITGAYYLSAHTSVDLNIKLTGSWIIATIPLLLSTCFCTPRRIHGLIDGICVAILIHGVISLVQIATLSGGAYPLWGLYQFGNSAHRVSALSGLDSHIRVFGLFHEPSDMAASLGHWILLLLAWRTGLFSLGNLGASRRVLYTTTLVVGALLMCLSFSGHLLVIGTGLLMMLVASMRRLNKRRLLHWIPVVSVFGVLAAVGLGYLIALQRNEAMRNVSWSMRQVSLVTSFEILRDTSGAERVIGFGDAGGKTLNALTGYQVWSVVAKSLLGFGLLQVIAWVGLLWKAGRSIRSSGSKVVGWVFLFVLMAGMLLTTSTETLAALWMSLAVLVMWGPAFGVRPSLRMGFYSGRFASFPQRAIHSSGSLLVKSARRVPVDDI